LHLKWGYDAGMAQSVTISDETLWNVYGVTNEMIRRDPEAAAMIASTPCPACGHMHGAKPCVMEPDTWAKPQKRTKARRS
jgi:hypothetical protein